MEWQCWIGFIIFAVSLFAYVVVVFLFERRAKKGDIQRRECNVKLLQVMDAERILRFWIYNNPGKKFNYEMSGRQVIENYIQTLLEWREVLFPEVRGKVDELIIKIQNDTEIQIQGH